MRNAIIIQGRGIYCLWVKVAWDGPEGCADYRTYIRDFSTVDLFTLKVNNPLFVEPVLCFV